MAVTIDSGKCTGCDACAEICPVDAITVGDKATVDEDTCIDIVEPVSMNARLMQ